jgi:hypothetical protein
MDIDRHLITMLAGVRASMARSGHRLARRHGRDWWTYDRSVRAPAGRGLYATGQIRYSLVEALSGG